MHRLERGVVPLPRRRDELARRRGLAQDLPGSPVGRTPRRELLEMAVALTGAAAGLAAVREHHVAELSRRADRTAIHLPVEDEPAADARAEGEHHHVARSASGADLPLGERRRVRVVVDPDRQREPLAHPVAEVEIGERNVHGRDRPARALVDRRREARSRSRPLRQRAAPRPSRPAPASRSSWDSGGSRAAPAGAPIPPSRSTTPAAIFVPPTSTPIVRSSATWLRYAAEWPREKSPIAFIAAGA